MSKLFDFSKIASSLVEDWRAVNDPRRKKKKIPLKSVTKTEHNNTKISSINSMPLSKELPNHPDVTDNDLTYTLSNVYDVNSANAHEEPNVLATVQSGDYVSVRRDQSFSARMALAEDRLRSAYTSVKQTFLSYDGVKSFVSWRVETVKCHNDILAYFTIRGKKLVVYYAVSNDDLKGSKYRYQLVSGVKQFQSTPVLYVVDGERKCKWACELADLVCQKYLLTKGMTPTTDFASAFPKDTEEHLLERMLIKEIVTHTEKSIDGWSPKAKSDEMPTMQIFRTNVMFHSYGHVTLEQLNQVFKENDIVDLASLKQKGLVEPSQDAWRVLPVGELNKPLIISTNYCPVQAASVIVNAGGQVKIYKSTANYKHS